jgi:hypothetical protein
MHRMMPTMRGVLLGSAAAAIFVTTTYGQINDSIRGAASEANHFIETPKAGFTRRRRGVSRISRPT